MTTSPLYSPGSSLVERFLDWTLDAGGHHRYGDEQERLRYYEGVVVAEGVRWHVVLWTLAGLAWLDDGSLAPHLLLVFAAFLLPGLLVGLYAARFKVRSRPGGWTRATTSQVALHVAPVVAFVAGLLSAHAGTDGFLWRVGAGLAAGVTIVALTEYVIGRTRRGHADGDEER